MALRGRMLTPIGLAVIVGMFLGACGSDRSPRAATNLRAESPPGPTETTAPTVIVNVRDAEDGSPIPGGQVRVQIVARQVIGMGFDSEETELDVVVATDACGIAHASLSRAERSGVGTDGARSREGPTERFVEYFVEADGHERSKTAGFRFDELAEDRSVDVSMRPAASIEGRVIDAATGATLAGARVLARKPAGIWDGSDVRHECGAATADDGGFFRITTLPPDTRIALHATRDAYGPGYVETRTGPARRTAPPVELRLAQPGTIEGIVRSGEGALVAGAKVIATSRSIQELRAFYRELPFPMRWTIDPVAETETRADGTFLLPGLSTGVIYTMYVTASTRTETTPSTPASIPVGGSMYVYTEDHVSFALAQAVGGARLDLVLARFPRVFVRLTDEHGVAIRGPLDIVSWIDGQGAWGSIADESGWAEVAPELGGVGLGRRRFGIDVASYRRAFFEVDLKPNDVVRMEVVLGAQ